MIQCRQLSLFDVMPDAAEIITAFARLRELRAEEQALHQAEMARRNGSWVTPELQRMADEMGFAITGRRWNERLGRAV